MKRVLIALAILTTLALWMASVLAEVGSPDALLSDADGRRQEQAIQNALEFNRTGQAEIWENAATGHGGSVTPTLTYRNSAGQDCRKFERELTIDGRQAGAWGTRCRTVAGVWLQPSAPRPVYTRGHDYRHRHYPEYRPYRYYPPVSLHLFYGFGNDRYWIGRHRSHRHPRFHRRNRPHRHGRIHRDHRPHRDGRRHRR